MSVESQETDLLLLGSHIDSNNPFCCYSVEPSAIPPTGGRTAVETT